MQLDLESCIAVPTASSQSSKQASSDDNKLSQSVNQASMQPLFLLFMRKAFFETDLANLLQQANHSNQQAKTKRQHQAMR
jgi:hypothetical protein